MGAVSHGDLPWPLITTSVVLPVKIKSCAKRWGNHIFEHKKQRITRRNLGSRRHKFSHCCLASSAVVSFSRPLRAQNNILYSCQQNTRPIGSHNEKRVITPTSYTYTRPTKKRRPPNSHRFLLDWVRPSGLKYPRHGKGMMMLSLPLIQSMPNAVAFPKRSPPRKPMTPNVRGTFPPTKFCRAVGGAAVKRTNQTFVARHPSQTNTEYYSNRSGRPQRLPPGYQYIYTPRALAHNIDIKQNVVPRQQSACQQSSSEPFCYATYTI